MELPKFRSHEREELVTNTAIAELLLIAILIFLVKLQRLETVDFKQKIIAEMIK